MSSPLEGSGLERADISSLTPPRAVQGARLAARRSSGASSRKQCALHVTSKFAEKDGAVPTKSLPPQAKASFTDANFPMDSEVTHGDA